MKKYKYLIIALFAFYSCDISFEEENEIYWEAEIVSSSIDCNRFVLQINEDSTMVSDSLGLTNLLSYYVVNMDPNEFSVGDKLMVKLRTADVSEIPICTTMGPSFNIPYLYLLDYEPVNNFDYGDTLSIAFGESIKDYKYGYELFFDSVVTDSRCNLDSCSWAGASVALFRINYNGDSTNSINVRLQNYAFIKDNYFKFIDLYPYPYPGEKIKQEDYTALISIIE